MRFEQGLLKAIDELYDRLSEPISKASDILSIVLAAILLGLYTLSSLISSFPIKVGIVELIPWLLSVALLGLISLSIRNRKLRQIEVLNRQTNESLEKKVIQRIKASEFFHSNSEPSDDTFAPALQIYILGITLGTTVNRFTPVLRERLAEGATIRIILLDHESNEALQQVVYRSWDVTNLEFYRKRINATLDSINIIGRSPNATGTLEVGFLPFMPAHGSIIVDSNSSSKGKAFIEFYLHNSAGIAPKFEVLAANEPFWFTFFQDRFEVLWKQCDKKRQILKDGKTLFESP